MFDPILLVPVAAVVIGIVAWTGGRGLTEARRRRYVASLRPPVDVPPRPKP